MPENFPHKRAKKVAVIQSNYIPWAGYFALMASVDLFVVYECVQYTKNDWRNRNQIQASDGRLTWLSIPIRRYSATQPFMETTVARHDWADSHFNTLRHHFARTKGWLRLGDELQSLYEKAGKMDHLFAINRLFLDWVINSLGIQSKIVYLDSYRKFDDPNERLISILQDFHATHYFSGPTAKSYINSTLFQGAMIDISYANYDQLIKDVLDGPQPAKKTSILQLILENNHALKCH